MMEQHSLHSDNKETIFYHVFSNNNFFLSFSFFVVLYNYNLVML